MSQVAKMHPGSGLPALSEPNWTGWMRATLRDFREPHPDVAPPTVLPVVADEAKRAIPVLEAALKPATADDWRAFLLPLLATVANPPDRAAFETRAAAIATTLNDVPAAALTPNAQREVMRALRFFPGPADLLPLLRPLYAERVADLAALRRIAEAPKDRPAEIVPQAVRDEMAARARALAGELRASAADADQAGARPARAIPLSAGALLAHYERLAAAGSPGAAARADAIRRSIGAAA